MNKNLSDQNRAELLQLLQKLVAIPSVGDERQITAFIREYLSQIDMHVEEYVMPNGRPNIFARWPDAKQPKNLMLSAHTDTVHTTGMKIDPFAGIVKDGKIFGRGACDTKSSLAVFLWTLRQLAPHRQTLDFDVQFLGTADEESGCFGSKWLVDNNLVKADQAIVGEPTYCQIAIAHRGSVVLEITTKGTSAHGSKPECGDNAIYRMCELIKTLQEKWLPKLAESSYPLLGKSTAAVTMISGGTQYNIIPAKCKIIVDLRILPGQTPELILNDLQQVLPPHQVNCQSFHPAVYTSPETKFVKDLLTAANEKEPIGVPYFADSSQLARTGAECIIFGPGNIANAHSANEFLELDQLYKSAEILLKFFSCHSRAGGNRDSGSSVHAG